MNLWLIPTVPLAASLVNLLFGNRFSKAVVNALAIGSVLFSFLWVLKALSALGPLEHIYIEHYFTWIQSGSVNIGFDFGVDRLTAVMLLVVTGIGTLIHIYAAGYMAHEGGYYRFFSYLNLFMFFMLTLVLAANYLLLFVGWEGVGLCSYLLIGFYFLKKSAGDAGQKAFIVNRIGDYGFSLALFLIFITFGSLDFGQVMQKAAGMPVEAGVGTLTIICLLLLLGATGKSAQVPLYVWLPDAMEGPTPVSALIHAATMVTAGVYMVARSSALYLKAPLAMDAVAIIGLVTAVLAAIIGLAQTDIKKVFAYSTVSQLGYMFLALGVGAFSAGIFHVVTHAFFKALLFLGAGSVIHALEGEQDMRNMGGLAKKTPWTFAVLLCAGVAIAGVPPFSGFHSKDAILLAAYAHAPWMFWVGMVTAGMTAFYVFRAIFMTFFGKPRHHHHPHESPWIMLGPLVVLAALSLGGGYFPVPEYLEPVLGALHERHDILLVLTLDMAAALGIALAFVLYVMAPEVPARLAKNAHGLYTLVYNKFFVDEAYDATIVHPIRDGSRSVLWRGVDVGVIDGIVNGVGHRARGIGGGLKLLQSGYIRSYATWVLVGALVAIAVISLAGGAR
jgi:NADH-quinone oxidoreductase subunit L